MSENTEKDQGQAVQEDVGEDNLTPPNQEDSQPTAPKELTLEEKYALRKEELLNLAAQALNDDAESYDWDELLRALHKIAGTAASFGDAGFGQIARSTCQTVKAACKARDRKLLLARALPDLQRAA